MTLEVDVQIPSAFQGLFQPYRHKALHGGRGGAKSRSIASALGIRCIQQHTRAICAREVQLSIRDSVHRLVGDTVQRLEKNRDPRLPKLFTVTDKEIRGPNDSLFVFAGLRNNPDKVKSMEGFHIGWVEEASNVSQKSIDLLIPTIRVPGSELWWSWNRRFASDPVDKMFLGGEPPPRSWVRKVGWQDNPWFPEELREEMEWDKRRDKAKWLHIWEGELLKNSDAIVFRNWRSEAFEAPSDAQMLFGADWGFNIDPTVLIRCFIKGRTIFIDHEAWKLKCEIEDTPALFDTVPMSRQRKIVADSARPETISHMNGQGFMVRPAKKGNNSVIEGVNWLKNYDIVVHPRCQHVQTEIGTYSYKVDDHTGEVTNELADQDNNTIDALRYAVEGSRRRRGQKIAAGVEVQDA